MIWRTGGRDVPLMSVTIDAIAVKRSVVRIVIRPEPTPGGDTPQSIADFTKVPCTLLDITSLFAAFVQHGARQAGAGLGAGG